MARISTRKSVDGDYWRGRLEAARAFHKAAEDAITLAEPGSNANPPQRSSKLIHFCSRKLTHYQSQFWRAPTVLFASERGQGRAAFFAARRSKPLTLRSGEYAGEWLCAQQFRAHNHDDKAVIPPSQVGQVYERKAGQFLRASRP